MISCHIVLALSASPVRASMTVHFRQGRQVRFEFRMLPFLLLLFALCEALGRMVWRAPFEYLGATTAERWNPTQAIGDQH